jgi:protein deglycase
MAASRLASAHDPMPTKPHVKPLALLVMADGSEELETMTIYDTLIRGGVHVVTAQVGQKKMNIVQALHGLKLRAHRSLEDCVYDRYDLIVLPGVGCPTLSFA